MKALASHVHFSSIVIVFVWHYSDPPAMPPATGLGIILATFAIAYLIPPVGMITPQGMASEKTLEKHRVRPTRMGSKAEAEKVEETDTADTNKKNKKNTSKKSS